MLEIPSYDYIHTIRRRNRDMQSIFWTFVRNYLLIEKLSGQLLDLIVDYKNRESREFLTSLSCLSFVAFRCLLDHDV